MGRDSTPNAAKPAILPVMSEEGCLVGPPIRLTNKGRVGIAERVTKNLDIHIAANSESDDKAHCEPSEQIITSIRSMR